MSVFMVQITIRNLRDFLVVATAWVHVDVQAQNWPSPLLSVALRRASPPLATKSKPCASAGQDIGAGSGNRGGVPVRVSQSGVQDHRSASPATPLHEVAWAQG